MDPETLSPRSDPTSAEICRGVARQLARLDEQCRLGPTTDEADEILRALRIDLGLAYAREAVRVAELRHRMAGDPG